MVSQAAFCIFMPDRGTKGCAAAQRLIYSKGYKQLMIRDILADLRISGGTGSARAGQPRTSPPADHKGAEVQLYEQDSFQKFLHEGSEV